MHGFLYCHLWQAEVQGGASFRSLQKIRVSFANIQTVGGGSTEKWHYRSFEKNISVKFINLGDAWNIQPESKKSQSFFPSNKLN